MDRNEQIQKMDELRDAMKRRDFDRAVDIADSLDLKRIKDNNILSLVADAYEVTHNFEEAKEALTIAYENTNAGRLIAYKLCLISVKTKDFAAARSYYEDFIEMAPRDTARYILRYRMAKAQGKPIEELINILEEYVNLDMEEKWAYELAKLYYKAGKKDKCLDICDEINLWFSEGKYVKKASDLKEKINNPKAAKIKKEKKAKTLAENSADEIIEITDISEDGVKAKIVEAPKMTEEPTIAEIVSNENGKLQVTSPLKNAMDAFKEATKEGELDYTIDLAIGAEKDKVGEAFNVQLEDDMAFLSGVVSRKKQIVPQITEALTK